MLINTWYLHVRWKLVEIDISVDLHILFIINVKILVRVHWNQDWANVGLKWTEKEHQYHLSLIGGSFLCDMRGGEASKFILFYSGYSRPVVGFFCLAFQTKVLAMHSFCNYFYSLRIFPSQIHSVLNLPNDDYRAKGAKMRLGPNFPCLPYV